MSKLCYLKLKNQNPDIKPASSNVKIQTCDGTNHSIMGFVNLTLVFPQSQFTLHSQHIMIVEQLSDDFILGSDILGSKAVSKIETPFIFFNQNGKKFKQEMNLVTYPQLHVQSAKQLIISPQQTFHIQSNTSGLKQLETPMVIKSSFPSLRIARIAFEDNKLITSLVNNTNKPISLYPGVPLIDVRKTSFLHSTPHDSYMNEDEIDHSLERFRKEGYYQPSVTAFIEDKSNITEADKVFIPDHVSDADFIAMFEIDHFKGTDREYLVNILMSTKPAFSMHKYDIGKTHLITMDIELINENDIKVQKYVPIAMHVIEKANEILDQMEKYDIIRECHAPSQYCSNILVIPKKDKNAVRLLFDGRLLNYNTKRMPVAIITKAEILAHLVNKSHLSSLDFADAFFHIPLTEKAQNLTAFWTPNHAKKMCFNRAPQGLRNSPMYLKTLLDLIFFDLSENVLFYADDLLIATNGTLTDHLNFLKMVLDRLVQAGLKLRPQKLLIARETINFLGMVFYKNTLSIPDLKLKAFRELPVPNTAKRLKSALCAFSYYRHFVPEFAHITHTLHEKASDKTIRKFELTEEEISQFKSIVKTICDNAMTYYPDKNKPFYVQTDASLYCAGGRLFQKDDDNNEMLIAAVSRTFTKTERNYTIYKKEALALLYTLRAFDYFLKFAPKLILLVDAKALIYIRLAKEGAPILLRFSLELSKYEADLIHVPGEQNEISDLLSRQHKDIPAIELEKLEKLTISEKDTIKIIEALTMPSDFTLTRSLLFSLLNGPSPIDDTKSIKKTKSKAQPGLKQVKNTPITLHKRKIKMPRTVKVSAIKDKQDKHVTFADSVTQTNPEARPNIENDNSVSYSQVQSHCTISNGNKITPKQFHALQMADPFIVATLDNKDKSLKMHKGVLHKLVNGNLKMVLPESLLIPLITLHHYVSPGIHKSKQQIFRDICELYYVSKNTLNKAIEEQINNCHICQLFSDGKQHLKILQLPRHSTTRLSWSVDLITDLTLSDNGFKLLLIAVDDFSNYIVAIPLKTSTAQELISAIKYHLISPFGIPKFIRSDEQPGIYNSKDFFKFFNDFGIELQATAVASPFSNGRAETTIKIFKHAARKYFHQENCIKQWDEHIPMITATLNSSINSYGFAPEEIMFGHRLENRYALVDLPSTDEPIINTEQAIEAFLTRIADIRVKYDQNKLKKHQSNATFKNKHANEKCFEVGDLVLHRQLQVSTGTASKYRPQLTGPYVIQAIDGVTATCKHLESERVIKAHFLNLAPYRYEQGKSYPPKAALHDTLG
jgi:transposase InsO family protein